MLKNLSLFNLSKYILYFSVVPVVISLLALVGWALDVEILYRVHSTFTGLNPLSAILYLLFGIVMFVLLLDRRDKISTTIIYTITGLVLVVSTIHFVDYLFFDALALDTILFKQNVLLNPLVPARFSLATASGLIFLCVVTLLSYFHTPKHIRYFAQALLYILLIVAVISLLIYPLGSYYFINTPFFAKLSLPSALLCLIYGIGLTVYLKAVLKDILFFDNIKIIGSTFIIASVFWVLYLAPTISGINSNFSYSAQIKSSDNFYDAKKNEYSGEIASNTSFTYKILKVENNVLTIQNDFKVNRPDGGLIFEVSRLYGVDTNTGKHKPGYGDKDRSGYLFAPSNLSKNTNFTYWHINYDQPLNMQYLREEEVLGLSTYLYQSTFVADQTNELSYLDTVGETTGIDLDVTLKLWIEPKTGYLVKYEDSATAYYYDLNTKERINPWNKFHNEYRDPSITLNVINAEKVKIIYEFINTIIPFFFLVSGILLLLYRFLKNKYPVFVSSSIPFIVPTISFLLVLVSWYSATQIVFLYSRIKFESDTALLRTAIEDRLTAYVNVLHGGLGLLVSSDYVTRDEWKNYVEALDINKFYPGVQGIGYSIFIKPEDLQEHIQSVKSEGFSNYTVQPSYERDIYTSIIYLEPFDERNQQAFGYDMYSEPLRRQAMDMALTTNSPTISGKITLVHETDLDVQPGFLIYLPYYKNTNSLTTIQSRKDNIVGFVYSPFRANNLFRETLYNLDPQINLAIYDATDISEVSSENAVFSGLYSDKLDSSKIKYSSYEVVSLFNHDFIFKYDSLPNYSESFIQDILPTIILITGGAVSILLYFVLSTNNKALNKAEKIALEMTKETAKFKLAVDSASDHIIITNSEGEILYANNAVETITGFSPSEIIGKKAGGKDLWGGQMPKAFYKGMWDTIKNKKQPYIGEITNKRKNGEIYVALASISPILDSKGNVEFFLGIERDITREKQIDKAKTEFVSLASHQLRTPLSAINWYAELMLSGDLGKVPPKQKETLKVIEQSGQKMAKLVDALLNVSRLELGTFIIEPVPTDIKLLLTSVLNELKGIIESKHIKVITNFNNVPKVNVDPNLMTIVLQNILTNAVKYTPNGKSVEITLSIKDEDIQFIVKDQGYGIPKSDQSKIFTKLYRAENVKKYSTDGNGLGLYIVKSIIDNSGGSIRFTSVEGKGTTFTVKIPLSGMKKKKGQKELK